MGDSLKWAAEKEEEEYADSPQGKAHKKRVDEWNELAERADELIVGSLTVGDLRFMLAVRTRRFPSDDVRQPDLDQLKGLVGPVIERIASLAKKQKKR